MTAGSTKRTRVFVVGDTAMNAARVEAILRGDPLLDVRVLDATAISSLETERGAIAIVAASSQSRLLERLRERVSAIVLLTPTPQEAWTSRARRSGVRAVLPLDVTAEELSAAVAATRAGLLVLHPEALTRTKAAAALAEPGTLTARELEILEMMAEGMSNRAIAARLKISRHTVKFHVGAILTKLGARTRAEAVTVGVRQGLLAL
jgi:two-component system, NarL family, response regulator YdfI